MKRIYFLFVMLLTLSVSVMAQAPMEKLRAMKVAHITEKLNLNSEQAKGFWPIYNQYEKEKRDITIAIRRKYSESKEEDVSDKEALAQQDEIFALKEKEAELSRIYRPRFLKVISASQFSDLLIAEKEFNQMLIQELRQRKASGR